MSDIQDLVNATFELRIDEERDPPLLPQLWTFFYQHEGEVYPTIVCGWGGAEARENASLRIHRRFSVPVKLMTFGVMTGFQVGWDWGNA